jgi:FkbM family methyltransferase
MVRKMFSHFMAMLNALKFPTYALNLRISLRILLLLIVDFFRSLFNIIYPYSAEICRKLQRTFLRNFLVKVKGIYFIVPDYRALKIVVLEFSEPNVYSFFERALHEGYCFLDVGAHIGSYSLRAAKLVGSNGIVVAVEPHPENALLLRINMMLNGFNNIRVVEAAAWNKKDKLFLYRGAESGWHSLKGERVGIIPSITVPCIPVDDVVRELGLSRVDLIKIDVEGAEIEVLEGSRRTLINFKPNVIVEVHSHDNLQKVIGIAKELDMVVLKLCETHYLLVPSICAAA